MDSNQNSQHCLRRLNETLLGFGSDPIENINRLVAFAGEQLHATYALYNRLEEGFLHSWGTWNTPSVYRRVDKPEGHLCTDVIHRGSNQPCVIRDLPQTSYATTDPNVLQYGLNTYIGKSVSLDGISVGSLCAVYQADHIPTDEDLELLGIVASAINVEEKRKAVEDALHAARRESEEALSLLNASLQATADGILVVDLNGVVRTANNKFAELWRIPESLLIMRDQEVLLQSVLNQLCNPELFNARVREMYSRPEESSFDILELKDGRVLERETYPQRVGSTVVGRVLCFRDVTQRLKAERELQSREALLKTVLDNMPQFVFWKDRDSRFLGCNRKFAVAARLNSPEEIVGKTDQDLGRSDDEVKWFYEMDRRVMESNIAEFDVRERRESRSGEKAWVETTKVPMHDAQDNVIGVLGICQDATERHRADKALAYRLQLEQLIAGISTNFINVSSDFVDQAIHDALRAIGSFAGVDRAYVFSWEQRGVSMSNTHEWCAEGITPQKQNLQNVSANTMEWWAERLERFEPIYIPSVADLPDEAQNVKEALQAQDILSVVAVPLVYRGELQGFFGFDSVRSKKEWAAEDIALLKTAGEIIVNALNRKRTEEALRLSDSILQRVGNIVLVADADGMITYASPSVKQILGYEPFKLLHDGWWKLTRTDATECETELAGVRNAASGKSQVREEAYENNIRHTNGEMRTILWQDAAGPSGSIIGVGTDITERKIAEMQLRKLSQAVEQSPSSIVITDTNGTIEYVNPKFSEVTGYSFDEVLGQNPRILKSGETTDGQYGEVWETILSGGEWRGEFHNKRKNGELFWEAVAISPIKDESGVVSHFLAVKEDITEKKNLETQFFRAQRMESLGTLAGGIAHDLNNVLAPINMSVHLLKQAATNPRDRKWLDTIEASVGRASSIVKQVLTFARGAGGERNVLQVRHLIKEMENIAMETFPRHIRIVKDIASDLWTVMADSTQLHQVLMNLCVNARDAMPDGGTLSIKAENAHLDENYARMHIEAKPGPYVAITVADSGMGIPPANLEKIFDPFFTTKAIGKGTGLGLSTVAAIVRGHGGFINVYSEIGRGTQFKIYLPATVSEDEQAATRATVTFPRGSGELVLIVDDEQNISKITAETLEEYGYTTLLAGDGTEALALYVQHKSDIHLVITDIMMPYMDGNALIRALRKINPDIKILATSGLTNHQTELEHDGAPIPFLAKPYTSEKLLNMLALMHRKNGA